MKSIEHPRNTELWSDIRKGNKIVNSPQSPIPLHLSATTPLGTNAHLGVGQRTGVSRKGVCRGTPLHEGGVLSPSTLHPCPGSGLFHATPPRHTPYTLKFIPHNNVLYSYHQHNTNMTCPGDEESVISCEPATWSTARAGNGGSRCSTGTRS